jgi:endoglucanase
MLRQLVATDGPSGSESKVADLVESLARDVVSEMRRDALGNLIARRRGAAEPPGRVMLAAHIDEIALIVTKVEEGFLHITNIGGVDPRTVIGQEVTVYPSGPGSDLYPGGLAGYVGSRPPHLLTAEDRTKVIPLKDLRVDLGLPASFFEKGIVRVGDRVVWRGPRSQLLNERVATKALDNRAGGAMLAYRHLENMQHTGCIWFTVQEEVGCGHCRNICVEPDLAIAPDDVRDTPE